MFAAIGSFLASSAGQATLSTGMNMLPQLLGMGNEASSTRSVLDFRDKQEEIRSSQLQSRMMLQARSSIGSARALLAGSGFGKGSTSMIVPQQSMINLESDLEYQKQHLAYMKSLSQATQGPSMLSNIGSSLFKQFGVPSISKGLGGLFSGGGGSSNSDYGAAAGGEFMQQGFGKGYGTLSGMGGLF